MATAKSARATPERDSKPPADDPKAQVPDKAPDEPQSDTGLPQDEPKGDEPQPVREPDPVPVDDGIRNLPYYRAALAAHDQMKAAQKGE